MKLGSQFHQLYLVALMLLTHSLQAAEGRARTAVVTVSFATASSVILAGYFGGLW